MRKVTKVSCTFRIDTEIKEMMKELQDFYSEPSPVAPGKKISQADLLTYLVKKEYEDVGFQVKT